MNKRAFLLGAATVPAGTIFGSNLCAADFDYKDRAMTETDCVEIMQIALNHVWAQVIKYRSHLPAVVNNEVDAITVELYEASLMRAVEIAAALAPYKHPKVVASA